MTRSFALVLAASAVLLVSSGASAQKGKPITVTVAKDGPHHAKVTASAGAFCGVDGGPLTKIEEPLGISTTRAHTVKCAPRADGRFGNDTAIPGDFLGKMRISPTFVPAKEGGKGKLTVALADQGGAAVDDVPLVLKSSDATIGAATDTGDGNFAADVKFAPGKKTFKVHAEVAGADPIEEVEVATDGSTKAADNPPPPPSTSGGPPQKDTTQKPLPPPAKEKPTKIEAGLLGGVGIGGKGVGVNVFIEGGISRTFKSVALVAMARGGYEKYPSPDKDEQIFSIAVPLTLRILPNNTWFPYLTVIPSLNFDGIVFSGLPGRDVVIAPAIGGAAGAEYKIGSVLGLFAEAGLRFGNNDHGVGKSRLPLFQGGIGARLGF